MTVDYQNWLRRKIAETQHEIDLRDPRSYMDNAWENDWGGESYRGKIEGLNIALKESIRLSSEDKQ